MAKKRAKTAPVKGPTPSTKLSNHLDRELVQSALAKRAKGQKPSKDELRALSRFERAKEDADRWRFYATIPKGHWQTMSGRSYKVLADQAAAHGVPIGGREIDLAAVVQWLHQFLTDNARKLAVPDVDDPLMGGDSTPALERYRTARAILAEMEIKKQLGEWIPRDVIHDGITRFTSVLRGVGTILQRSKTLTGAEAHQILNEGLDDAEKIVESFCGELKEGSESDGKET
ncbi:MAG: hypothetical protein NTW96_25755 [Planctomycetia bacterium]|nr:hypothetical protein [Planctomycetia bacterium]